jgi:hypothetical protein
VCIQLRKIFKESRCDAKISIGEFENAPEHGYVRIEGMSIHILDMEGFARACEFSDNVDIYPMAANKVRVDITFYNMLVAL